MSPTLGLLRRLVRARVDFIVVGGMAGVVHGATTVTNDLDVCAAATAVNMERLLAAVAPLHPCDGRTAQAPPLEASTVELASSEEVSVWTDLGRVGVLWSIPGVGGWADVSAASELIDLGEGDACRVLRIDALIASKRALSRTRDLIALEELEEIRRRRDHGA